MKAKIFIKYKEGILDPQGAVTKKALKSIDIKGINSIGIGKYIEMEFEYTPKVKAIIARLEAFMKEMVYPNERVYEDQHAAQADRWISPPIMEKMKSAAKVAELWNLFLPDEVHGEGLTNLEYAIKILKKKLFKKFLKDFINLFSFQFCA